MYKQKTLSGSKTPLHNKAGRQYSNLKNLCQHAGPNNAGGITVF